MGVDKGILVKACKLHVLRKSIMSTMIGCWVAPFSNIVAMDVFLPIIKTSWKHDIDEEPNLLPPLRLCASFWEWLSERGGVVPKTSSNLDSARVGVVVSNLGDCGLTSSGFKDFGCFFCIVVTTTLDPHLRLHLLRKGWEQPCCFQPYQENYLHVWKAELLDSLTPLPANEMKAGNQWTIEISSRYIHPMFLTITLSKCKTHPP